MYQNHMIVRYIIMWDSINFDHLRFFNMCPNISTWVFFAFDPHRKVAAGCCGQETNLTYLLT